MVWSRNSHTRHVPYSTQRACFTRDHFTCRRCGFIGEGRGDLHADHGIPVHRGGTDDLVNLVTLCVPCHDKKSKAENSALAKARAARRRLPERKHPGLL